MKGGEMKKLVTTVIGLLFVGCICYSAVAAEKLLKTGQTAMYWSYDDGFSQNGIAFSYTNNGDGMTVTDNVTGLMWAKDGAQAGCNSNTTLVWTSAINWVHGLTFAAYSDWRLPNYAELCSLMVQRNSQPTINKTYFPNTQSNYYWSSTTGPGATDGALSVRFSFGDSNNVSKANALCVRAVRGGM
jgi:hypothetical protein